MSAFALGASVRWASAENCFGVNALDLIVWNQKQLLTQHMMSHPNAFALIAFTAITLSEELAAA